MLHIFVMGNSETAQSTSALRIFRLTSLIFYTITFLNPIYLAGQLVTSIKCSKIESGDLTTNDLSNLTIPISTKCLV